MSVTRLDAQDPSCSQATSFPLNPDFDLQSKLGDLASFSSATRLHIMGRQYREGRTQAMLENKLLVTSLLRRLQIPAVRVLYGGFASHALGEWPQYKRTDFAAALRSLIIAGKRQFVLKSATDGMSQNILIMNADKWTSQGWTVDRVTQTAEEMILQNGSGWFTHWGQKFEHRGVLLQEPAFDLNLLLCAKLVHTWRLQHAGHRNATHAPSLASEQGLCDEFAQIDAKERKTFLRRAVMELKLHVAWGSLRAADGRVHIHPGASGHRFYNPELLIGDSTKELKRCLWPMQNASSAVSRFQSIAPPLDEAFLKRWPLPTCELVARMLGMEPIARQLEEMADKIARATGADWFRLDAFATWQPGTKAPTLIVNELTYPSHNENHEVTYLNVSRHSEQHDAHRTKIPPKPDYGAMLQLVHGYRCRAVATALKVGVQRPTDVFRGFGIDDTAAFEASDYVSMRKPPAGFFDHVSNHNGQWDGKD